ncbi:hypothetical protein HWI79_3230 [Cryptosporidium felis]|nr:hypothetical protein HWI79_3230 [Cryptosporidium felis]
MQPPDPTKLSEPTLVQVNQPVQTLQLFDVVVPAHGMLMGGRLVFLGGSLVVPSLRRLAAVLDRVQGPGQDEAGVRLALVQEPL